MSKRHDSKMAQRVLEMFLKLQAGKSISKKEEAVHYGVCEKTIQRDIKMIRNSMDRADRDRPEVIRNIVSRRNADGSGSRYWLESNEKEDLSDSEMFAVCEILLDSRAFPKKEMDSLLERLIKSCLPEHKRKPVDRLIMNERFHYVSLQHNTEHLEERLWEVAEAIQSQHYIEIDYERKNGKEIVTRRLHPGALMFSEFYFYMAAFIEDEKVRRDFEVEDDVFPTIYRIDRIKALRVLGDKFRVPYTERFEGWKLKQRMPFMYGGRLVKAQFKCKGDSLEAVLDRFPAAEILKEEEDEYTIRVEVFGKGFEMWIRSQGERVYEVEYKER